MIRYALVCDREHGFEGWFGTSDDYDDQSARGLLACPVCDSGTVRKQIMAPAVTGTKAQAVAKAETGPTPAQIQEAMTRVRDHVETNFDYVGDTFAREARAIHEGKSDERGIYGEAAPAEVKALVEDGIGVLPLPPAKREIN